MEGTRSNADIDMVVSSDVAGAASSRVPHTIMSSIEETAEKQPRVDPITALQDGIDSLSLSMFEALRGLRDAVAPGSGNLGGQNNYNNGKYSNSNNNDVDSYEEFWQAYHNDDPDIVASVNRISPNNPPTKTADFIRIHSRLEIEKDALLVAELARRVLEKSAKIDERVALLPGMDRTKQQQMEYIEELLQKNNDAYQRLTVAYKRAGEQREKIRQHIMQNTSSALGIFEDEDDNTDEDDED
jgi:hypothetical protein